MQTDIRIRPSFFAFWALFCILDREGCLRYFVAAAALHELGHGMAVWLCGGRLRAVELAGPGVCMETVHSRGYWGDFWIAAGGPMAGVIGALVGARMGWTMFGGANVLLTAFNCLPILPLDGGCMVVSLLCMSPLNLYGADVMRVVSRIGALAVSLFGLVVLWETKSNVALLVIGLVLLFGRDAVPCKV